MNYLKLSIVATFIVVLIAACNNYHEQASNIKINTTNNKVLNPSEFLNPPDQYKTWVFWWWLKGWIDEEGIRADLDHMKNMGISGALVFHAGPATNKTPFTTEFLSPKWMHLFRYAVEQAAYATLRLV